MMLCIQMYPCKRNWIWKTSDVAKQVFYGDAIAVRKIRQIMYYGLINIQKSLFCQLHDGQCGKSVGDRKSIVCGVEIYRSPEVNIRITIFIRINYTILTEVKISMEGVFPLWISLLKRSSGFFITLLLCKIIKTNIKTATVTMLTNSFIGYFIPLKIKFFHVFALKT